LVHRGKEKRSDDAKAHGGDVDDDSLIFASKMAASDTMSSVELPSMPAEAQPVLGSEDNAAAWPSTPGFRAFWGWCQRRCDRIQGKHIMSADVPSQYEVCETQKHDIEPCEL
jgi:hypothetical protein